MFRDFPHWCPPLPLHQPPLLEPHDSVHLRRQVGIVGGDQRRQVGAAGELEHQGEDVAGGVGVEVAGIERSCLSG